MHTERDYEGIPRFNTNTDNPLQLARTGQAVVALAYPVKVVAPGAQATPPTVHTLRGMSSMAYEDADKVFADPTPQGAVGRLLQQFAYRTLLLGAGHAGTHLANGGMIIPLASEEVKAPIRRFDRAGQPIGVLAIVSTDRWRNQLNTGGVYTTRDSLAPERLVTFYPEDIDRMLGLEGGSFTFEGGPC